MKSGELHVPASLSLEKDPFLAIGQEIGRDSELVWLF